jgi:magnesium chelatase family protein
LITVEYNGGMATISKTYTAHLSGLTMEIITVEVDISNGLHSFSVVGLGDRAVEESKDRIAAAIKNNGYQSPKQKNQKVVISLAPAHIRKEGPSFDLAMAMAYLAGAGEIEFEAENVLFLGELSLEGNVRGVYGLLTILIQATKHGFTTAFIPKENSDEARLARDLIIYPVSSLREVIEHISHKKRIEPLTMQVEEDLTRDAHENDFSLIRGNEHAKRALEIAVAGCHNIMLHGPPGTGKTMLAKSLASIMPKLTYEQSIEVTGIHSVAHKLSQGLITRAPFRAPHHSASASSILGGGPQPRPGEVTLAHRGILYLDELSEFERETVEGLRQPLEDKTITISRARGSVTFPAQCMLVASMNPCRCGKGKNNGCICSVRSLESYKTKISGPIIDRIDMWVSIHKIDYAKLAAEKSDGETSVLIRERVSQARKVQEERFLDKKNQEKRQKTGDDLKKYVLLGEKGLRCNKYFNSEMDVADIDEHALLEIEARTILAVSAERMALSGRAFHRVIKVARTIADLAHSKTITKNHILEALQYRQKVE